MNYLKFKKSHSLKKCDPFIGAAAIGALGSAIGGLFGKSSTDKTNETNLKIAREQNAFNQKMWEQQRDYNTDMWNAANEYNTPAAQFQRLKAAGLSDWAAASALSGSAPASASPVTAPSAAPAAGATMQPTNYDFVADAAKQVGNAFMNQQMYQAQLRKANAEADSAETDAAQKEAYYQQYWKNMMDSQLANMQYDEHNKRNSASLQLQQLSQNADMFLLQKQKMRNENNMLVRSIVGQELTNASMALENKMKELNLKVLPDKLNSELALLAATYRREIAAGNLSFAQAKKAYAEECQTWLAAENQRISNEKASELADALINQETMNFLSMYENTYGTDRHYNRAGKVLGSLGTILGIGLGAYGGSRLKGAKSSQIGFSASKYFNSF